MKEAKEMGLIERVKPILDRLRDTGLRIKNDLYFLFLESVGEFYCGKINMPLITDEKDPKWVLLGKILGTSSTACCHAVATANA